MRTGIEVDRIGDVGEAQRIGRRDIHVLAPGRGTHDNDAIRVEITDNRNNLIGVALDAAPLGAVRFIGNFIDQVLRCTVAVGHFGEEGLGLSLVNIRVAVRQDVPVDNNVHIQGDRRIDDFPDRVRHAGIVDITG